MNRVLLTFTGFHDPYSKGLVGQEDQRGPILSLVAEEAFDRIILFSTPATEDITLATEKELARIAPETTTEIRAVPLSDPTDCVPPTGWTEGGLSATCISRAGTWRPTVSAVSAPVT